MSCTVLVLYVHERVQRGGGGGRRTGHPLENHKKYGVSLHYWSGSPEKSQRYKVNIQCWAMTDDGPFKVVFGSSIPSSFKKNIIKFGPPLTKLWIRA